MSSAIARLRPPAQFWCPVIGNAQLLYDFHSDIVAMLAAHSSLTIYNKAPFHAGANF